MCGVLSSEGAEGSILVYWDNRGDLGVRYRNWKILCFVLLKECGG